MIHIPDKFQEVVISIPRNEQAGPLFTLCLQSEMTFQHYEFEVMDLQTSKNYYKFRIDPSEIDDGEYRYFLRENEDTLVALGLAQIGNITDQTPRYVFFTAYQEGEGVQYYPQPHTPEPPGPYVRVTTQETIPWSATQITFTVEANVPWSTTLYLGGGDIGTITGESGTYTESFSISANTSTEPRVYLLAYGDIEGDLDAREKYITQDYERPYLIMSAASYTLAAEDDELTWSYDSNKEWKLTVITPWGEGETYINPGSGTQVYAIGQNEEEEPRVFTYSGATTDGTVQTAITFTQEASAYTKYWVYFVASGQTILSYQVREGEKATNIPTAPEISGYTFTSWDPRPNDTIITANTTFNAVYTPVPVPPSPDPYKSKRFSVEMLEDGDIEWDAPNLYYDIIRNGQRDAGYQLDHSIDGLLAGDVVEFYVNADNLVSFSNYTLTATGRHNVYGNIMSIVYADFEDKTELTINLEFANLFLRNTNLISAENLILPATTLANGCYYYMFLRCSSLTKAPTLLAITLAEGCCINMFAYCTSLTTAPELPATTLANDCYFRMFQGCSSLTKAPELPATTLAGYCYSHMFEDCSSLTKAPELPATTLAGYCYSHMFNGCTNLNYIKCLATENISNGTGSWVSGVSATGDFWKMSSATWSSGKSGKPNGWTSHNIDR